MGLPNGWVTHTPHLSRAAQLRLLGNGVVPAQAIHALTLLTGPAARTHDNAAIALTQTARRGDAAFGNHQHGSGS